MTRQRWIAVAVVAVVVVTGAIVWAATRSGGGDNAGPGLSPGVTTPSPAGSGSVTPSTIPGSPSPTQSAGETQSPSPSVSGSTAPDGKPLVTVETPTAGEHADIPVHASGTAVAFEGVARYEILKNGKLFTNGPLYADKGTPARGHWETDIELPIGKYTLVVFLESPKDGKRIAQTEVPFYAG